MDNKYYQDVHEKDYGEPAVGGILVGIIEMIVGLFALASWAWRKYRE